MQETWIWSLGQEDPLEKKWRPTPILLPGKPPEQRSLEDYSPWGHKRVRHNLATKQQQSTKESKNGNKKLTLIDFTWPTIAPKMILPASNQ